MKFFIPAMLILAIFGVADPAAGQEEQTLWLVPHFHHDIAYMQPEPWLNFEAAVMIEWLVWLAQTDPDFKFVVDQVVPIEHYIDVLPHGRENLAALIQEGRLEIPGAMYIQPDLELATGESYVRQIELGQQFYEETFGIRATGMWNIDSFGHPESLPQICAKSGLQYAVFQRNENRLELDPTFIWRSPDGSELPTLWLAAGTGYDLGRWIGTTRDMIIERETIKGVIDLLWEKPHPCGQMLAPCGQDQWFAGWAITEVAQAWNDDPPEGYPVRLVVGTPSEFFQAVAECEDALPVYEADFQTDWNGYYASRIDLKQQLRAAENGVQTWEKVDALTSLMGISKAESEQDATWQLLLVNEFHDTLPGSTLDRNIKRALERYEQAETSIENGIGEGLQAMAAAMDTSTVPDADRALVLFNPLAKPRPGPQRLRVELPEGWETFAIVDGIGNEIAFQNITGSDNELALDLDLPALSFTTLYLRPGVEPVESPQEIVDNGLELENGLLRLEFNDQGTLTAIVPLVEGLPAASGLLNELTCEADQGDVYSFNRMETLEIRGTTSDFAANVTRYQGPVLSRIVAAGPFVDSEISRETRLAAGSTDIYFRTGIDWRGNDSRIAATFDLLSGLGTLTTSIPYGFIERAEGGRYDGWAVLEWADYSGAEGGFTMANRGIPYATAQAGKYSMLLLRAMGKLYDIPIPLGQMHGLHVFEYGLHPHGGNWEDTQSFLLGWEMNRPVESRLTGIHEGALPAQFSLFEIEGRAVDTVFRTQNGGYELRLFHNASAAEPLRIRFSDRIEVRETWLTDLRGERLERLDVADGVVEKEAAPQEIVTLWLDLAWLSAEADDDTADDDATDDDATDDDIADDDSTGSDDDDDSSTSSEQANDGGCGC